MNSTLDLAAPAVSARDRSRTFTWVLQQVGESLREEAALHVSHDKDRKTFYATISKQWFEKTAYGSSVSFELYSGLTLLKEPVARYSEKALTIFGEQALRLLTALFHEGNDQVAPYFVPQDRSCGCADRYHEVGCETGRALIASRGSVR